MRPLASNWLRTSQWPKLGKLTTARVRDSQHLAQHFAWPLYGLKGARQHHIIEAAVGIVGQVGVGVAVHHRQAVRNGAGHQGHVDLDAASVAALGLEQMVDQHAVAAADVQNASTRLDHVGDQRQIDPHVLGDEADLAHGWWQGQGALPPDPRQGTSPLDPSDWFRCEGGLGETVRLAGSRPAPFAPKPNEWVPRAGPWRGSRGQRPLAFTAPRARRNPPESRRGCGGSPARPAERRRGPCRIRSRRS